MTKKFIDMHVHTSASDGELSPEEVVKTASELGLAAIAIADHDTVDGIEEALEAGKKYCVEVIPGVELSSEFGPAEVHILGYFIDWRDKKFRSELHKFQEVRKVRAKKMIEKLRGLGVAIPYEEVVAAAGEGVIGRPHVAQVMVKHGYVKSKDEAFERYIGDGQPAHVPKYRLSPKRAIQMIHRIGGVAVLAHPVFSHVNDLLYDLVKFDLDGIEVYHSEHDSAAVEHYERLANDLYLLMAGGTDSHDRDTPIGSVEVSYELLEKMKAKREHLSVKI
jgi:predicted metal-dependent phosphoesterase TrpH